MMDFSCDDAMNRGPSAQTHSLREFEQHLNDLKKENFSLKLRIYFLEEKIQQKFEESSDDVHKRNIELKVEVESLKKELEEKQQLLDKVLLTTDSLSNQNEEELQRHLSERHEEISHMQKILETKVQLLQEEAELARAEAERMASLAHSESQRCLALQGEMRERTEEQRGSAELITQHGLTDKDRVIKELTKEKQSLGLRVEELEIKVQNLSSSVKKRQHEAEQLTEEQQGQLSQYESAAGQCVSELQKAQDQVHSLQAKIRESESRNQKLQERLGEMELELRSSQEEVQQQERNIQNVTDIVNSKEAEAADLCRVIEEQNMMLCSLKELASHDQLKQLQVSGSQGVQGQGEVLALQAALFQAQLELQAGERAQRQAARIQEDLTGALQRLENDLQGAMHHRRETERHNQELQLALEKVLTALQDREEQLRKTEEETLEEEEMREKSIRKLMISLQSKEQLLEDYCEMLEEHQKEKGDSLLHKLRQRVRERDRALERAVDEKFRCMEEKEEEARRLRFLLREKERDLGRQCCVLVNNEETIASLEVLLKGKAVELEQVCDAWRSIQQQQKESEEKQRCMLEERDAIISQLQAALQTRTQEAQDLRYSLLAQIQSPPSDVLEELKMQLQVKDRLFQEVLADRTRQAQEHQGEVQCLLTAISSRDQYILDTGRRHGEMMTDQTLRLQELRRQLSSDFRFRPDRSGSDMVLELQALREELRLALQREKQNQELSGSQTANLESLSRALQVKEEVIRDLQRQMVDPSGLPLVEQLTQEVQELRESLVQHEGPPTGGAILLGHERPSGRQPEFGEVHSEDGSDLHSEDMERGNEEVARLRVKPLTNIKGCGAPGEKPGQDVVLDGQGLMEVKQLVEKKRPVERELGELKAQLEKSGFSSLTQMRKSLFSLQAENEGLKHQLEEELEADCQHIDQQRVLEGETEEEEEEELDVTIEGLEEEECSVMLEARDSEPPLSHNNIKSSEEQWTSGATRPESLHRLPTSTQSCIQSAKLESESQPSRPQDSASHLMSERTVRLQQKSKELKERLMVSEATVQAQAEQLKDYRELLNAVAETTVQQDSKLIQVDLQDLGYETCGRSENEAEREDTSSPEFDDLAMCTSLDCGSQWWPAGSSTSSTFAKSAAQSCGSVDEVLSLRRLVENLRSQLSCSQGVIRRLQSRLRSLSTSSDYVDATPRKVNWCFQATPSQSGTEDDEGWQSSDGGRSHADKSLQELVSRVDALENQLWKGGKKSVDQDGKSSTWSGKFDTLIQAQARELSHLRQRLREGRSVCNILTQHLGDATKAFEELLRANDIDYYMGQSFRDQLVQSSALAQRVCTKINGRDHPEDQDEKTELIAIRLSKELQQKDKVIECLRAKLNQHHHHHSHRSDTPCSSLALSDATDQSDRSYVSDEHVSTNEDLQLCCEVDAASELGQDEMGTSTRAGTDFLSHSSTMSQHPSVPPSIASSNRTHSCHSCLSIQSHSSPHNPADMQSQTGFSTTQPRPLQGFPFGQQQSDSSAFLQPSFREFQPSPFSSCLDASLAMKARANLLESSALWDMAYGPCPARLGADLSSGSSGYQSGKAHTGSELMKEHLREVRSLRQRLEDSIHTNDLLRLQLEDRLTRTTTEKGAPTNIYIQGLHSVSQLSSEIRLLKEENVSLQNQLKLATAVGLKEVDQLKEAAVLDRTRLKEAELEMERWMEQSRKFQQEANAHKQEITQLMQERQRSQETISRLQHEVSVLRQQLCESCSLVHSLQLELQVCRRVGGVTTNIHSGQLDERVQSGHSSFDPRELHVRLEQQLGGQPRAWRQLFKDNVPSPPVRDTGLVGPSSPLHAVQKRAQGARLDELATGFQGKVPDGSFASHHGLHVVGHIDDFRALQQQILEGSALLCTTEAVLQSLIVPGLQESSLCQVTDASLVKKLRSDAKTLRQILDEVDSLLRMFWRAHLPDPEEHKQDESLTEEVASLRLRLSKQEQALKDAMERVKSSNRTKDCMEHFIVSQLSRTRDILKKAKTNLQVKTPEASVSLPSLLVGVS